MASEVTDLPLPDSPTSATVEFVRDVERDALDRVEGVRAIEPERDVEVADADQGFHGFRRS